MTNKSKRIRKLLKVRPIMMPEAIARKIGMPTDEGAERVWEEIRKMLKADPKVRDSGPATGIQEHSPHRCR